MSTTYLSEVLPLFRRALRDGEGRTDGQLLEDYIGRRSEAAFAALVGRHGPMVWGVCRRALGDGHDAEDAFQATFLVLVRRASSVASRELLANWLYGVARQTALKARASAAKRKVRERQVTEMPDPATTCETQQTNAQLVLDEELARLPERQRAALVLCDLEGRTRKEAAAQLGCPEGTVASRLVRARELLAKRLNRRGVLPAGGLAVFAHPAAEGNVPKSLLENTIERSNPVASRAVAAGPISGRVSALAEGVINTMLVTKLKPVVAVVLLLACLATGAAILTDRATAGGDGKKSGAGPVLNAAVKRDAEDEVATITAWGEELGGLQAGLGFLPGQKRTCHIGEEVTLVVRVRNVGRDEVTFPYLRQFLAETPPTVMDDDGRTVPLPQIASLGIHDPVRKTLAPGEELVLHRRTLKLRAAGPRHPGVEDTLYGTGKFWLKYSRVFGDSSAGTVAIDPALKNLGTRTLELDVIDGERAPEKPVTRVDARDIVGDWAATVALRGGKRGDPASENMIWSFGADGKLMIVPMKGGKGTRSTYTVDAKRSPASLDVADGPKGEPVKAIYKLDGHTLTLCWSDQAGERPTAFESPAGGSVTLLQLTRGGENRDQKKAVGDTVIRSDHIVLVESSPVPRLGENTRNPAKWSCLVQSDGTILLTGRVRSGPDYGRVRVLGLTVEDAEKAIAKWLAPYAKNEVAVNVTLAGPKGKADAGSTPEVTGTIDGKAVVFTNGKDTLLLGLALATFGSAQFATETSDEQWAAALKRDHVLVRLDKPHALKTMVEDGKMFQVTHLLIATSSNTSRGVVLGRCDGKYLTFGEYESAPLQLLREKYLPPRQPKE